MQTTVQRSCSLGCVIFIVLFMLPGCVSRERQDNPWSERMALSVIHRAPEPWNLDTEKTGKWEYTFGLVCKALLEVWEGTQDGRYFEYVKAYYDHHIDSAGQITVYRIDEYNIDRINSGKPLFRLFRETRDERYRKAIHLLRSQMKTHPRTSEGGFWHKAIYPHQMWLDGIYMASPFLAEYAATFNEPDLFDDVAKQVLLMEKHARDPKTGLLRHGWDESRSQRWADPLTGLSPHFWGRSMGWYAMALVDILDFFPAEHPRRPEILAVLNRLAAAVVSVQDSTTGLWHQVLDMGGREGNYPESSASSMLVYALAKAAGKGYLPAFYLEAARKGYQGILDHFIEVDADGLVNIHRACAVAGLGGDPYRDGSYDYYIHERIRSNDPKAVGPFILASLEMEKTGNR
ncbi:glycoside hydrolase family 88 protein [bacterium]|nr:glycoside hydrolase family 88 protein [bacterium]